MKKLAKVEQDKFLNEHFLHRLTLLCTHRDREKMGYSYTGEADIYCCVKDSSLIMVRMFLDFLGLKGVEDGGSYKLVQWDDKNYRSNDICIKSFGQNKVEPISITIEEQRILGGVYCRANKELAHFTEIFNVHYNDPKGLCDAATLVEELLVKHLFTHLKKQLPKIIR